MLSALYIFTSLIYSIDIFAYYRLLNHKLTLRFSKKSFVFSCTASVIFYLLYAYTSSCFPNVPVKIPHLLLFFITLFFTYKDIFYKRILWISTTFFIIMTCELFTIPFFLLLTNASLNDIVKTSFTQTIGVLFSRCMLLIIIEVLIRSKKKIHNSFSKDFFLIILVDVIYALIIVNFFYFNSMYLSTDIAIVLSLFVMLIISVLALYLLRKITKKSEEIMMTNLKLQQIEMEHKQNQDMAIVVEDLRALRHDMNNHMSVLQGLLDMKEYEDAKAYLSTITEELSVANSFVFIDNKVLSVLINNKISKARQLGIPFDVEIMSSTTPFSDSDLCAVLGNILENAIEASSNHENPYIYFSMKKSDNRLLIQCDNTYTVTPVFEKGNLITTKSEKGYHGIGTKTIRSVVESYQGTCEFTVDEQFHVNISVPI